MKQKLIIYLRKLSSYPSTMLHWPQHWPYNQFKITQEEVPIIITIQIIIGLTGKLYLNLVIFLDKITIGFFITVINQTILQEITSRQEETKEELVSTTLEMFIT